MGRRWRCLNGHSDKGQLALPTCPVCGLPVTVEQELPAVASRADALATPAAGDVTLVGQLPSAEVELSGRPGRPTPDQKTRTFPPPEPARDNGNGSSSAHPPSQDADRPAVVNWLPLVSGVGPISEHPTLVPPPSIP